MDPTTSKAMPPSAPWRRTKLAAIRSGPTPGAKHSKVSAAFAWRSSWLSVDSAISFVLPFAATMAWRGAAIKQSRVTPLSVPDGPQGRAGTQSHGLRP